MGTFATANRRLGQTATESDIRKVVAGWVLAGVVAWALSVYLSSIVRTEGTVSTIALVLHILSLVVAFGAIILVDWHGFLWLLGRRELSETIRLDGAAGTLIWGGLAGLLATGVFLNPVLTDPLTQLKLAAVLIATLNGIMLIPLMKRLVKMPPSTTFAKLPLGQRFHMVSCALISQTAWWTAIIVGFINAEG
jgi:hypothetical protein